ncbi:MAG: hypothetical protein OEM01_03550 [Desulfobulbaceae bacterium]|nr:hypothetical protein [Desulfobulbaceae bacterium]
MKTKILLALLILTLSLFVTCSFAATQKDRKAFLGDVEELGNVNGKEEINPLLVSLSEADGEIKIEIHYENKADKKEQEKDPLLKNADIPAGGEFTVFLDDLVVLQQTFTGEELKVDKILPSELIQNGKHKLRLEIFSHPGGNQAKEVSFNLDATPIVEIKTLETEEGVFDPRIHLILFGSREENVGFLQVYIDESLAAEVPLKKTDLNKTLSLSDLIGEELNIYGLPQGLHLIRIAAIAVNGSQGAKYESFEINIKPEILVEKDQENHFNLFTATFPKTSIGFYGSVDVYYRQGVIFSKQAKESHQLSITRSEIKKAFDQYKHNNDQFPVDLVFSARSASGSERWTRVEFK